MADLSIAAARIRHDGQFGAADVSTERRDAGVDRGAGGGVLRESLWDYVPGAAAQRTCRASARSVTDDAARDGLADAGVRVPWPISDGVSHVVRSADRATYRAVAQRPTDAGRRVGARELARAGRHSFDTGDGDDGPVPAARADGTVADFRPPDEGSRGADVGLRFEGIDAADGVHRDRFFEADSHDLQGAVPA